ncbi:MAG TPA: hypothetical protein VGE01_14355 [Fimbriimonas sp.]
MGAISEGNPPAPPSAPKMARDLRFYRLQAIGVPLLALLPILALFGFFDTKNGEASASEGGVDLQVSYPSRFRFRTAKPFTATVRNDTGHELTMIQVKLEKAYVERFKNPEFVPEPSEADDRSLVFEMKNVGAGESRRVFATFEADEAGPIGGSVRTATELGSGPSVGFRTFALP